MNGEKREFTKVVCYIVKKSTVHVYVNLFSPMDSFED